MKTKELELPSGFGSICPLETLGVELANRENESVVMKRIAQLGSGRFGEEVSLGMVNVVDADHDRCFGI